MATVAKLATAIRGVVPIITEYAALLLPYSTLIFNSLLYIQIAYHICKEDNKDNENDYCRY